MEFEEGIYVLTLRPYFGFEMDTYLADIYHFQGAAFGFSSIATSAGDQLAAHLPKIVPRLYRYQFDPNPRIQNSMASIWHTLVPETSKTVDKYHKEILDDLIQNLTSNQWRVRQSCCLAVSDFIRGSSKRSIQVCIINISFSCAIICMN